MKFAFAWSISIVFVLSFTGCASKPLITVQLFNRTGGACPNASIELNGRLNELSANVPNGNASDTSDYWPNPMPTNALLRWTTEDQRDYSAALNIPQPPTSRSEFLDYHFVILPNGRANVILLSWSGEPTDSKVEHDIVLENKLCCNGGPDYRVAVKNMTGYHVDDLAIRFGPYAVNAGTYVDNTEQNYSIATGLPYSVTKSASLHWKTSDGRSWSKDVDLTNLLPPDLNGKCFWFILKEQGSVEAKIVEWSDLRAGKYPDLCHGF